MRPENLPLVKSVSAPTVHGDVAVVSVTRPDFDADAYVGQLWRVGLDGGAVRRITRGHRDTAPRFSPDGRVIGFLRATPDGPAQLAIVPAEGGEPMVITDRKLGVTEFAFTPDSRQVVFVSRVPEAGRYGTVEGIPADAEDPRPFTGLKLQLNGVGWLTDKRSHLFVVDLPDPWGEPPVRPVGRAAQRLPRLPDGSRPGLVPPARQITSGDFDHQHPVPVAGGVIAVSARHSTRERDLALDLYRFDDDGQDPERLTGLDGGERLAARSPVVAGDRVFFVATVLGESGRDFVGANSGVFAMPLAGGPVRRLTEAETLDIEGDLAVDGDAVLAVANQRGRGVVLRVTADGQVAELACPGSAVAVGADAGRRVVTLATTGSPGEVALVGAAGVLTDFAADLRAAATAIPPRELVASAPDGYPVHGWVVLPAGEGPHPVLLTIHGGPFAAYGPGFFDEAQVFAAAGYAVVMCNPRGSAGYGQEHGRAIQGALGRLDMADVLAFLDGAIAEVPGLDADRVGIMGGSYGGYLTAWIIAHDHRFAAAIVERGFLDPRSFVGAADIGWYFPQEYTTADPAAMDAQSPMHLTDHVRTPTLVIHSEQDLRCPLSQALRYYGQLRLADVPAELLVFPGENHELSRSGSPLHRRQRFEAILAWWRRHLPPEVRSGFAPGV